MPVFMRKVLETFIWAREWWNNFAACTLSVSLIQAIRYTKETIRLWLCPCACHFTSRVSFTLFSVHVWQEQVTWEESFCTVKVLGQTFDWKLSQTGWLCPEKSECCQQGLLFFFFHLTRHQGDIHDMTSWLCLIFLFSSKDFQAHSFLNFLLKFFENWLQFPQLCKLLNLMGVKVFSFFLQKTVIFLKPAAHLHREVFRGRGVLKRSCQYILRVLFSKVEW